MALPPLFAAAMAALALAFSGHCRPAPLTLSPLAHQDRIKARLDPGALAPAAPSPAPGPALTDRDWTRLAPGFNQALQKLFARMAGRGYGLTLLEGYRSPERQTLLYHSGRNLTRAQAGRSLHQYGLAADLALPITRIIGWAG
jgi:peptidoglycan L-alanyl-D-glutamate endopeptidase CwlK